AGGQPQGLGGLRTALSTLEKYGRNLLQPGPPALPRRPLREPRLPRHRRRRAGGPGGAAAVGVHGGDREGAELPPRGRGVPKSPMWPPSPPTSCCCVPSWTCCWP
ncbi:unnamed protein product, partial [Bubo scandiacus]